MVIYVILVMAILVNRKNILKYSEPNKYRGDNK